MCIYKLLLKLFLARWWPVTKHRWFSVTTRVSHAHTVVWECCKDDQQSQWEIWPATNPEPLERSSPNLACLITSWISFTKKKFWAQSVKGFLLFLFYTRNIHPPCSLPYTHVYYFFWFFQSPTAETPAWILTLKTSNDAVLRKEVPFEGYKSEITYLTEF